MQQFIMTPVFWVLLHSRSKFIVLQGGTNSGKTYNSLIYILQDAIQNEKYVDDLGIAHNKEWVIFVSDISYSEKNGAYKDLLGMMDEYELWEYVDRGKDGWEKRLNRIKFRGGGRILFATTNDLAVARKGTYVNVYFPEVNSVMEEFFDDVKIRTKNRIIVDFNSDSEFYIHELINLDRCLEFKDGECVKPKPEKDWTIDYNIFNYHHNIEVEPYLDSQGRFIFKRWLISKQMREQIESYCVKCEQTGMEKWCQKCKVLARGLTGGVMGLVYPDVEWVEDDEFEHAWFEGEGHCYGADYGYVNSGDPSVVVKVVVYEKKLYAKVVMYEYNLSREGWRENLTELGVGSEPVYFDSSQAKEVFQYLSRFFYGLQHAKRYPGGVLAGIKKVQEYDLRFVKNPHFEEEQQKYKWKRVKGSYSKKVNPVDKFNHIFDPLRYCVEGLEDDAGLPSPEVNKPIVI